MKISEKAPYILEMYELTDNLNDPQVLMRRGLISRDGQIVCYALNKFFNWGESYAAKLDWSSAIITEKIDGSLIKFWFDLGEWHISTNGTIDAADAEAYNGISFLKLVKDIIGNGEEFYSYLDPLYTYFFELTTPYNMLVVQNYPTALWYLGRRNIQTLKEDNVKPNFPSYIKFPRTFQFNSLEDCVAAAKLLDRNEEGYVVRDKDFNRIKVKGAEYLQLAKIRGNGTPTPSHLLELWRENRLDDFIGSFPQYRKELDEFAVAINKQIDEMELAASTFRYYITRKEFASDVKNSIYNSITKAYLFKYFENHDIKALDFLMKCSNNKIKEVLFGV